MTLAVNDYVEIANAFCELSTLDSFNINKKDETRRQFGASSRQAGNYSRLVSQDKSKWILAITYNCLKSLLFSQQSSKLLTLAFTRQPSRRAMFPKPSRAWRSSLIELMQREKAMREKKLLHYCSRVSSLKSVKLYDHHLWPIFRDAKASKSDSVQEVTRSRSSEYLRPPTPGRKFEAILLSPCQIR